MAFLILWFGAEAALARIAGWHWSIRMASACVLRDVLLPLLWIDAWLGSSFTWRGTVMRPREAIEVSR
jgi:ceramide glucosyltransferase